MSKLHPRENVYTVLLCIVVRTPSLHWLHTFCLLVNVIQLQCIYWYYDPREPRGIEIRSSCSCEAGYYYCNFLSLSLQQYTPLRGFGAQASWHIYPPLFERNSMPCILRTKLSRRPFKFRLKGLWQRTLKTITQFEKNSKCF